MNATIGGICASLAAGGYSVKFQGFSALDRYMGLPALPFLWAETDADLAVLARYIENLRFPGADIADGAADTSEGTCYFRCVDAGDSPEVGGPSFPLLSFIYDWRSRRFQDPLGLYPLLRELRDGRGFNPSGFDFRAFNAGAGSYRAAMEGALILARYSDKTGAFRRALEELLPALGNSPPQAAPELERTFLTCLMVSPRPGEGLEFLKGSGFLGELWPELAALDDVDHS
jgi:poly(A) polymerase